MLEGVEERDQGQRIGGVGKQPEVYDCIVLKKVYSKLSKPMSELNLPSVRRRYYPVKTKLSAVRDRVINEMGYAEVLAKYEVKPSTFHVWLHKYKSRVLSEEQHKRLSSRNYKMLYPRPIKNVPGWSLYVRK